MRSPNLFLPIACLMALAAAPATAQATQLDVKTGLWEMTSTIQMHGPVIPPEALAQMPPAMRDKMTAMIQGLQKPQIHKSCLTQEKLSHGFDVNSKTAGHCQNQVLNSSSSELEFQGSCHYEQHSSTIHAHFIAADNEDMTGTVDVNRTEGEGPSDVHVQVAGKWLGADCGDTKD